MSVMIVNVLSDLGVNDQRRSSITIYCYFNHRTGGGCVVK
jgi:hypothetical protein